MKQTYRVLAGLVALGVVVQAAVLALGWFDVINQMEDGAVFDKGSDWPIGLMLHGMVGMTVIPLVALLLLVVSFFAKVPGGVKWAGGVLGLVVLQVVLAFVAFGAPVVGALHGMNALALLTVAVLAARRVRPTAPASPAVPPQGGAPADRPASQPA